MFVRASFAVRGPGWHRVLINDPAGPGTSPSTFGKTRRRAPLSLCCLALRAVDLMCVLIELVSGETVVSEAGGQRAQNLTPS